MASRLGAMVHTERVFHAPQQRICTFIFTCIPPLPCSFKLLHLSSFVIPPSHVWATMMAHSHLTIHGGNSIMSDFFLLLLLLLLFFFFCTMTYEPLNLVRQEASTKYSFLLLLLLLLLLQRNARLMNVRYKDFIFRAARSFCCCSHLLFKTHVPLSLLNIFRPPLFVFYYLLQLNTCHHSHVAIFFCCTCVVACACIARFASVILSSAHRYLF
ncbi:transmembrane protein, putative [Bodo saltans]|uniref:Transmembrane protein, putative n=1 Tax=Bodo saltans TaxID=75058 RepID=A0A0S4J3M9_BODSA|nr:transmembrane protein, putative [Bodo saltans]|eukprot:CUG77393.1 transmembrane protein, putative [Bodo saltans]